MKHLLITTIAAVLVVGCGESQQLSEADRALLKAAAEGNIKATKQAIADGADVNAEDPFKGLRRTPLHEAAYGGYKEIAELLIANGADVNAKDKIGWTPLFFAAFTDATAVAELLIAEGVDVNAKNDNGWTPLNLAVNETIDLLRKHGGKTGEELENAEPVAEAATPEPPTAKASDASIHDAARTGRIEYVKQHLIAGTDVNAKDEDLFTPLHYAAETGHKEIVELLLANGADVNAKDDGVTPLHFAAGAGRKEIVELLITEGADVNAKLVSDGPHKGKTPLNAANEANHPETADLLRKHGGKTADELKAEGK
jgi:ankyrin repeat protein